VADVFDKYDLYDPTALAKRDQSAAVGAAGFGTGLVFLLPLFEAGLINHALFSALVGGGVAGLLALRKDKVGDFARDVVGQGTNKVTTVLKDTAIEADEKYQLREKAKKTAADQVEKLKQKLKE
jgi:hypothetical protein